MVAGVMLTLPVHTTHVHARPCDGVEHRYVATPQAEYGGKLCIVTYIIVTTYFPAYSRAQNMQIYCLGRIFFISLGIIVTMAASVIVFPRCASGLGFGAL